MPNTPNLSLPYPSGSSAPNVPADISSLAAALDNLLASLAGWTNFTPTWTAATTNPSLGNGTLTSRYQQLGKTVTYAGAIVMGSTTTYGTGTWLVSLPVAARSATVQLLQPGGAYLHDASTVANRGAGSALLFDTTKLYVVPGTAGGSVGSAAPFTWANGDALHWTLTYEAA